MGSIKQKEKVGVNVNDEIYVRPITKTRTQEMQDRLKERQFGNYDDLKDYLGRVGGHMVHQTETLPQGDIPTYDKNE